MLRYSRSFGLAVMALVVCPTPAAIACDVYWTGDDGVYRAHADGSDMRLLVPGQAWDVDVDVEEGKIYFMDSRNIKRVGLDGLGLETVHSHPNWVGWSFANKYMTIDPVHRTLYHTYYVFDGELQQGYTTLACKTFDGVGCGATIGEDGVAVDPLNGWLYSAWGGWIRQSPLDCSSSERWFDADNWINGLAIDLLMQELYWTEPGPGRILRKAPEGAVEVLAGLGYPRDVAVDPFHRHVYWVDTDTAKVQRAHVDRPIVQDLVGGVAGPRGLTVDPRSVDLRVSRDEIQWEPLPGTVSYDLVKGDLQTLRETAGDFGAATLDCLANNTENTSLPLAENDPDPGEGFWYLSRADFFGSVSGSYGACDSSQFAPRDEGLDLSIFGCP